MVDYISAIGPQSTLLPNDEISGSRPVNRHGEVTQNAFVDSELWNQITQPQLMGDTDFPPRVQGQGGGPMEPTPQWHEWASTTPGEICVTQRDRHQRYKSRIVSETAVPVICSAALLDDSRDNRFVFAGITRSKSIRDYDEQTHGPKRDEFFTLAIGGMHQVLNNGNGTINVGDYVEWTFWDADDLIDPMRSNRKRQKAGPRKIQVRKATTSHARVFGRAMSFAKRGEPFDVLIGSASM